MGVLISLFFPIPVSPLLIDRSYCPPEQWQQLTQAYQELYQNHQQKKIRLDPVIFVNSLGEEPQPLPPTPEAIAELSTFGRPDGDRLQQLQKQYANAKILSCSSP